MDNKTLAAAITKALGYTENGGKPDINDTKAGKTGELKSIFQFEPDTWKAYSTEIFGQPQPLTPDNETHVVLQKVNKWLDDGFSPQQIASMWNAGPKNKDAYKGTFANGTSSVGVNEKYGVKYDVPGYVEKFNKYLSTFTDELGKTGQDTTQEAQTTPSTNPSTVPNTTPVNTTPASSKNRGLLPTSIPSSQGLVGQVLPPSPGVVRQ